MPLRSESSIPQDRPGADGIIEPEDERGQPPVVPAIAEAVDRCGHIRQITEVRIRLLQRIVQHAVPQSCISYSSATRKSGGRSIVCA